MTPLIADFLWVSDGVFLHWMLAISITLLVLDVFFFNTDFLTLLAMGLFAAWGTMSIAPSAQWTVLTFFIFILIWALLYYGLWKNLISPLLTRYLNKRAPEDDITTLMQGKKGTVCGEPGSFCIKVGDQLIPIAEEDQPGLTEGSSVTITSFQSGAARIRK